MGPNTRTLALLVVCALLSAVLLSACGGDDDSSSSTAATTSESSSSTEATTGTTGSGKSDDGGGGEPSAGGGSTNSGSGNGGGSGVGGTNLDSSERSSAYVTPGGDNSIQEFGDEGDSAERAEALVVIEAIGKGSETGKWDEVCDKYLSTSNLEQFEAITQKVPQFKGKDCAEILGGLSPGGKTPADPSRPKNGIASIRGDDENAFAIYTGVDGNGYAFPMAKEDGALKATALAPTPLNPGG
jgi:hypothetical protein